MSKAAQGFRHLAYLAVRQMPEIRGEHSSLRK